MIRYTTAAALLLANPALAQTTTTTKPASSAAAQPEKQICRAEIRTGSIMAGKKVCHTKAEWAAIGRSNGAGVDAWRSGQSGGGWNNPGS